jgi:hypothetical protein
MFRAGIRSLYDRHPSAIIRFRPSSPPTRVCLNRSVSTVARVRTVSCRPPRPGHFHHARGKKTKTTVRIEDLPQGTIPLDPEPAEDDGPAYPTVVLQARRNMQKFDNCVLLTRVGGFYELYFEQAEEYGPLLNLKVAQKKTSAGPVPMVNDLLPWHISILIGCPCFLIFVL